MKILITGSRGWDNTAFLYHWMRVFYTAHDSLIVVHGDCKTGADAIAARACTELQIEQHKYPADWERYGKQAGHKRNAEMLAQERPNLVVAFDKGSTPGTAGMVRMARLAGYPVRLFQDRGGEVGIVDYLLSGTAHLTPQGTALDTLFS